MKCLHCNVDMQSMGIEKIQLGEAGLFIGLWGNLLSGSLDVEIFICDRCKKLEFFLANNTQVEDQLAQINCPYCNKKHDFDDAKCPHCNKRLQ